MTRKSKEFGEKLKNLLEKKGMTQREFAKKMFLSESTVGNYAQGTRLPRYEIIRQMAEFFDVSIDYLLGIDKTKKSKLEEQLVPVPKENVRIPILGSVRAGMPTLITEDNIIDYEYVSEELLKGNEAFALIIKGDSMEPYLMEGDVAIVKRTPNVDNGKIAVVLVNGDEATIKKIMKSPSGVALIPYNNKYDILTFSNDDVISKPVVVAGQVIEVRRKMD